MTAIVGILCRDGLVIGTDSSATSSIGPMRTIEQPVEKLSIVADTVIIAGTGQLGLGQRFCHVVETAWSNRKFTGDYLSVGKELAREGINDFRSTNMPQGHYGALVGFPLGDHPHLCELAVADFQPEFKTGKGNWFVSMGSGQPITDPFLALMREIFWQSGPPTVQDAIFAVAWALDHVIKVNPGGINGPIRIAVLERDPLSKGKFRARMLDDDDLQEHFDNIAAAKERLRTFPAAQTPAAGTLDVPTP
jgi:hypothetical protein